MTNLSSKGPRDGVPCAVTAGPDPFRPDPDTNSVVLSDVQALLLDLRSALADDLPRVRGAYPLGLLVVTRPRPPDVTLFALRGTPGRWHAAYPTFTLQAIALRYAREVAHQLWENPPLGAVWCLVLLPDAAVVVPFELP